MDPTKLSSRPYIILTIALLALPVTRYVGAVDTEPTQVALVESDGAFRLMVDGQPFRVAGAGGDASKALLAECGGNSFRTWGADNLDSQLDEAERLGLKVAVGIWLGHERHGFDYADFAQVAKQQEAARQVIVRYKDHPAVLLWGLGNEMEGFEAGDNPAIWAAVNNIAKLAKSLDPHHPTMTTVAEIGGRRVAAIHSLCPEIDIVGINSYGGAASIPKRYREAGGKKPYLVTEFGPPGSWEVPKNEFGVVVEPTSTRKAEYYRTAYSALESDRELCLGSYAFTWGSKREATATWFGMLLPDGSRLEAVKALQQLWSGKPPTNACPKIASLRLDGPAVVKPQAAVRAKLQVSDPDGDPLRVEWRLERDYEGPSVGGDFQAEMPSFPKAVLKSDASGAELKMPIGGGPYRLYAFVRDDQGNAAAANLPLLVDGPKMLAPSPKAELPLVVYGEAAEPNPYIPSGWMGDTGSISLEPDCAEQPQGGKTCLRCGFSKTDGWGGVVWLSPDGDWGDQPGGFDLTGARQLSFWARGADGGERVTFSFGIIDRDKPYYDSAKGEIGPVELTREWKQFRIGLDLKELHRIKTGFCWVVAGQGKPLTFYLDNIRFE